MNFQTNKLTKQQGIKLPPKFNLANLRLARLPNEKSRQFDVRPNESVREYKALNDPYLQQFFRRSTRMKLLSIFSTEVSLEEKNIIDKIKQDSRNRFKSSYQNLVNKKQHIHNLSMLTRSRTAKRPADQKNNELQQSQHESPHHKIITEPSSNSTRKNTHSYISKDQFQSFLSKARQKLKLKSN